MHAALNRTRYYKPGRLHVLGMDEPGDMLPNQGKQSILWAYTTRLQDVYG